MKKIKSLIIAFILFAALGGLFNYAPAVSANYQNSYDYEIIYQSSYPKNLSAGEITNVYLEIKNTGNAIWYNNGDKTVRLGSGSSYGAINQKRDYASEFASGVWLSPNRPVSISDNEINPGKITKFQFDIKAPDKAGLYRAYFTPVVDGIAWMKDLGIYWEIKVEEKNNEAQILNNAQNYLTPSSEEKIEEKNDYDNLIKSFAPSVVKIICKKEENSKYIYKGSGTLFYNSSENIDLPKYYILTNLHVVKNENPSNSKCLIQLFPYYKNNEKYILFKANGYQYYSDDIDIAILTPEIIDFNNPDIKFYNDLANYVNLNLKNSLGTFGDLIQFAKNDSQIINGNLNNNDNLIVFGFPEFGGGNLVISNGNTLGFNTYQDFTYVRTNAEVSHGSSGGMAINDKGEIIGIPSRMIKNDNGNIGLILYLKNLPQKILTLFS